MEEHRRQIASNLRQAREGLGLSQTEAAARLQKPQSFVSKCESGNREITAVDLIEFGKAYDVSILYFLIDALDEWTLVRLTEWLEWKRSGSDDGFRPRPSASS